jgi:hypothetical protein
MMRVKIMRKLMVTVFLFISFQMAGLGITFAETEVESVFHSSKIGTTSVIVIDQHEYVLYQSVAISAGGGITHKVNCKHPDHQAEGGISHVEVEGHEYLFYQAPGDTDSGGGLTHKENCSHPSHQKHLEVLEQIAESLSFKKPVTFEIGN